MKIYKHKTQRTRNAQLTYCSMGDSDFLPPSTSPIDFSHVNRLYHTSRDGDFLASIKPRPTWLSRWNLESEQISCSSI